MNDGHNPVALEMEKQQTNGNHLPSATTLFCRNLQDVQMVYKCVPFLLMFSIKWNFTQCFPCFPRYIFGSNVFTTTGPLDMKVSWNLVSKGKWWLVSLSCPFSNPSLIGLLLKGKLRIEGTIDDHHHHHHHHHDVYRTYALANQAFCHSENDQRPPSRIMPVSS